MVTIGGARCSGIFCPVSFLHIGSKIPAIDSPWCNLLCHISQLISTTTRDCFSCRQQLSFPFWQGKLDSCRQPKLQKLSTTNFLTVFRPCVKITGLVVDNWSTSLSFKGLLQLLHDDKRTCLWNACIGHYSFSTTNTSCRQQIKTSRLWSCP